MTLTPSLRCAVRRLSSEVVVLVVHGDLNYDTADELLRQASTVLQAEPAELRLDCAALGHCDAHGLSALLMIHRRAQATGVRLRLDARPPALQQLLTVTGTLRHICGHEPD